MSKAIKEKEKGEEIQNRYVEKIKLKKLHALANSNNCYLAWRGRETNVGMQTRETAKANSERKGEPFS